MNDINWGGKVTQDGTVTFEADVSASPMISPSPVVSVTVLRGYTCHHVAALFAAAWNATVNNPKILAIADGAKIRFPGDPVAFGTRKVNGTVLDPGGVPLPVPSVPGLHVHVVVTE